MNQNYKIQVREVGGSEWQDMLNLPKFHSQNEALEWLNSKGAKIIKDIFEFRIVSV